MLRLWRVAESLQHCLSWNIYEKILRDDFGFTLYPVRTMVIWESIFIFFERGKSETVLFRVMLNLASFGNKKLCALKATLIYLIEQWQNIFWLCNKKKIRLFCVLTSLWRVCMQEKGNISAPGEWLGWYCVLVPTLARNFPQVVGRDLLFFKKKIFFKWVCMSHSCFL